MWRYVVSEDGKVTDIYFLTQLTPDEKVSMVSPFPVPLLVDLDAERAMCSCPHSANIKAQFCKTFI